MTKKLPITANDVIVTAVRLKPEARKRLERHFKNRLHWHHEDTLRNPYAIPTLIQIVEENLNAVAVGGPVLVWNQSQDRGEGYSNEQMKRAVSIAENMAESICEDFFDAYETGIEVGMNSERRRASNKSQAPTPRATSLATVLAQAKANIFARAHNDNNHAA